MARDGAAEGEDGGGLTLAAAELVKQGAAVAAISSPNTRFADWLTAVEQTARDGEVGLWGECGGLGAETAGPRRPAAPQSITISVRRRDTPI